jgi:hypothetical protein
MKTTGTQGVILHRTSPRGLSYISWPLGVVILHPQARDILSFSGASCHPLFPWGSGEPTTILCTSKPRMITALSRVSLTICKSIPPSSPPSLASPITSSDEPCRSSCAHKKKGEAPGLLPYLVRMCETNCPTDRDHDRALSLPRPQQRASEDRPGALFFEGMSVGERMGAPSYRSLYSSRG